MGKSITIGVLIIGLLALALTINLLVTDGSELLSSGDTQDYTVSPLLYLTYFVFFSGIIGMAYFYIKSLISDSVKLKRSVMVIGGFILLFVVCYLMSSGNEFSDKNETTDVMAQLVESGLRVLYVLLFAAVILIFLPAINMLKKK